MSKQITETLLRFLKEDDDHDDHKDGDDHDDHGHAGEELLTARILMTVFVVMAGLFVFLPYLQCIRKRQKQEGTRTQLCRGRLAQFSFCFAAGMLFSLSVCHILPETIEGYNTWLAEHEGEHAGHDDHDDHRLRFLQHDLRFLKNATEKHDEHDEHEEEEEIKKKVAALLKKELAEREHKGEAKFPLVFFCFVLGFLLMLFLDQVVFKVRQKSDAPAGHEAVELTERKAPDAVAASPDGQTANGNAEDPTKDPTVGAASVATESLFTFGLAVALHSLLDGLAIGVFEDPKEMAVLASTVVIHKIPVAYTVGVTFMKQNQPLCKWQTLAFFVFFVLSTPLGIIIGAALDSAGGLGVVIVQGLAGGTFVYLACCDFIVHEFQNGKDIYEGDDRKEEELAKTQRCISLLKFMFVALGFAVVVTIFSLGAKHAH